MTVDLIPFDAEKYMTWPGLCDAFDAGHKRPRAQVDDTFIRRDPDTVLSRTAWIDGMGLLVKTATIFPGNPAQDRASINGAVNLYSDGDGTLKALIDFHLVTKWKTAGDSLWAASKLARKDSRKILLVGAGTVAHSLYDAYQSLFPDAEFTVWNRSTQGARRLAAARPKVAIATDLQTAVEGADIISCATMSTAPLIHGDWLRPGQHVDLIGAYRADMREVDDTAITRGTLFVDNRDTTIDHIGELKIPIANGVITPDAVVADYYDMAGGTFARTSDDQITIFKNGGGAHLDLMTADYIQEVWRNR